MNRSRIATAIALVGVVAIVLAALMFRGGSSQHHASRTPSSAAGTATQPAFVPGARDTGAMLSCERSLTGETVRYAPNTTDIDGATVIVPTSVEASHLAFYLQAVRYDACTGRDFERTGPPNFRAHWACDAWSAVSQLRNAGMAYGAAAPTHGYPVHNALGTDEMPPAGC